MTSPQDPGPPGSSTSRPRSGLRFRLWFACLGGTAAAVASLGALIWLESPAAAEDPRSLLLRLMLAAVPALLASIALALWLDGGITRRARRLVRGLHAGQLVPNEAGGEGWGEFRDLTQGVHALLHRQRQLARAADELQRLERQITSIRNSVDRWVLTERWQPLAAEDGVLLPLVERLNQGFARESDVLVQNQQAAIQVRNDLLAALATARESAEQAEHGFDETTALLTTVGELQRLSRELQSPPVPAESPALEALEQWRAVAAGAIEELIGAANQSVEHLGEALLRVREIAEQVHLLANRATLIALNSLISGSTAERPPAPHESAAGEMKQLAREVRNATDRVGELSDEVEREVRNATDRMRGIRERVAARLQEGPVLTAEPARPASEVVRLVERMREMVQDATRKGERLAAAGERTSRSAEALVQKLEDDVRELEGLAVRLAPTGTEIPPAAQRPESGPRSANLRVLGSESPAPADPESRRHREERP